MGFVVVADVVSTVGILGWIIIGGIAGALAGCVVTGWFWYLGDIVVGILGALLGGFLAHVFGLDNSVGLLGSLFWPSLEQWFSLAFYASSPAAAPEHKG